MSSWDYRVVRRVTGDQEEFDIHEVYYDAAGQIEMWSLDARGPGGATLEELRADLRLIESATDRPMLDWVDLPGYPSEEKPIMNEWLSPTHTVIVPGRERLDAVIDVMIRAGQVFTVQLVRPDVWHVGLMPEGVEVFASVLGSITDPEGDEDTR